MSSQDQKVKNLSQVAFGVEKAEQQPLSEGREIQKDLTDLRLKRILTSRFQDLLGNGFLI